MKDSPCYNTKTRTDCPKRCVGCRSSCEEWKEWQIIHAQEKDAIYRKKQNDSAVNGFLIGQGKRAQAARHRKYVEGAKK